MGLSALEHAYHHSYEKSFGSKCTEKLMTNGHSCSVKKTDSDRNGWETGNVLTGESCFCTTEERRNVAVEVHKLSMACNVSRSSRVVSEIVAREETTD